MNSLSRPLEEETLERRIVYIFGISLTRQVLPNPLLSVARGAIRSAYFSAPAPATLMRVLGLRVWRPLPHGLPASPHLTGSPAP
jgi:hypothetical protein